MSWNPILTSEIEVGDPITNALMTKIKDNDDFLYSTIGTLGAFDALNGSFEIDADASGVPDSWTKTLHPGGAGALSSAGSHGKWQYYFTAPSGASNGGGYLTSDYIPIGPEHWYDSIWIAFMCWGTGSGIGAAVKIESYQGSLAYIGTDTIWTSTSIQESPDKITLVRLDSTTLGTAARYLRIIVEGGTVGPGIAGSVYFDGVTLRPRIPWNWDDSVTFTEQSTTSATYATVASPTFHAPCQIHGDEMITFPVEVKHSGTTDLWVRANIGAGYSGEYKVATGTSYETVNIQIPNTLAGNLTTTVNIQLKTTSGTAYAKKSLAWAQHSLLDSHKP